MCATTRQKGSGRQVVNENEVSQELILKKKNESLQHCQWYFSNSVIISRQVTKIDNALYVL